MKNSVAEPHNDVLCIKTRWAKANIGLIDLNSQNFSHVYIINYLQGEVKLLQHHTFYASDAKLLEI